jgi:hypothetical protein
MYHMYSSLKHLCICSGEKYVIPRVDVMMTIFCDFPKFSAKKLAFFLKYQCYDQLFQNLALF